MNDADAMRAGLIALLSEPYGAGRRHQWALLRDACLHAGIDPDGPDPVGAVCAALEVWDGRPALADRWRMAVKGACAGYRAEQPFFAPGVPMTDPCCLMYMRDWLTGKGPSAPTVAAKYAGAAAGQLLRLLNG